MASRNPNKSVDDFQRFFNTINDLLFVFDLKGSILYSNKELSRCLGFTNEELLRIHVLEIFSANHKDEVNKVLENIPKSKKLANDIPLQTKVGQLIPVETKLVLGKWSGEDAIYAVSRDATTRTSVEAKLRSIENQYNLLTDNVRDVLWIVDLDLRFTYISASVERVFGYTIEETMSKTINEFFTQESFDILLKEFIRQIAVDNPDDRTFEDDPIIEVEMFHKDGSKIWIDLSRTFVRDDDGAPIGVLGVARDITIRKQANEMQERERKAFNIIDEAAVRATTVSDLCLRVMNEVCDVLEFDIGAVKLYNKEEQLLEVVAVVGLSEEDVKEKTAPLTLTKPEKVTPFVIHTLQDIFTLDSIEPDKQEDHKSTIDGPDTSLAVSWPIRDTNDDLLGVMMLMTKTAKEISEKDRIFVQIVAGVFSTVLERRRAEEKLRDSEEALNSAFEKSAIGMIWVHPGGKFKRANQTFCEMIGYSEAELLQKKVQDITHSEDYHIGSDTVTRMLEGEIDHGIIEKRHVHKDGSILHRKMTTSLIRDTQGNPIHFSTQVEDITKQQAAIVALQESEAKWRSLTEYAPSHIILLDLEARIIFLNHPFPGMAIGDLVGQSLFTFIPQESQKNASECLSKVVRTGKPGSYFLEYVTTEDENLFFEALVTPIIHDGKVESFVVNSFDITERTRFNEELEQLVDERTKELREAQEQLIKSERFAILGQLSGGIGHEIRNPLATIKSSIFYLKMTLDNPSTDITETLDILEQEIDSTENIVKSLLDYAQPDRRNLRKININEIINSSLSKVIIPEGIKVTTRLESKVPDLVADSTQLSRIVINLCRNAIQSMGDEGKLTVKTEVSEPGWLQISVTDTGVGMTDETRKHLFEPLFTTKAKGIGLGLPIANLFVKAHGVHIDVQSALGKGTTFIVYIPLQISD